MQRPRPGAHRRPRNQFKAYLIYRLTQLGERLPPNPSYADLQTALDRILRRVA